MTQPYFRGSILFFNAVCSDKNGNSVTPNSATLYVSYTNLAGVRTKDTVAMTVAGSAVSGQWDSSVAQGAVNAALGVNAGFVEWSIHTTGTDKITKDGNFTLYANSANTVL
jgi:hypothetical protein